VNTGAPGEWTNWSGSIRFRPASIECPHDEDELAAIVRRARDNGRTVRVIGSGHSSTGILETDNVLISMEHFTGLIGHDHAAREAVVGAGTTIEELGPSLLDVGLGPHDLGDVATQTVAGAIGTGTHGTGRHLKNLSSMLAGGRMVTGEGRIVDFAGEDDPELLHAARVALGTLGIFTQVRLKLVRAYRLVRREYCTTIDACMAHFDELIAVNRNVDFYWYPRSDEVKLRLLNPPGGGSRELPFAAQVEEQAGWAHEIIPKHSNIPHRFEEMEYALPFEAGPACFEVVRRRVKQRWRAIAGWRLLYRLVAADDAWLSPCYGRPTVTISLHQNSGLPWQDYFSDIEPIFRDFGGRPHWAKKHTLGAEDLRPLYPRWDRFMATRAACDPDGVFISPYLAGLFGIERSGTA
jgi:FAD/FMN-containing dehydrogenase